MSQFKRSILPLSFLFFAIGCGGSNKMKPSNLLHIFH
jgi:hypothetical protein